MLETESYFKDYVLAYTNAATLVNEDFQDTEDLGGVFSGFDPETGTYDRTTWMYEGGEVAAPAGEREHATQAFEEKTGAGMMQGGAEARRDAPAPALRLPQLMRHFARYTPEMVEQRLRHLARGLPLRRRRADRELRPRAHDGARATRVGWTQHTAARR